MNASTHMRKAWTILLLIGLAAVIGIGLFFAARLSHAQSTETRYVSGLLAEETAEDLFEQSTLIAFGTVTGKSDAFQIQSVSGSVSNFTDYSFTIDSTLRGCADSGTITVRIQGGVVGNYAEVYEHSPTLEENHSYLLFLYQPGMGGSYNTEGDYYYILGLTQGTFSEDDNGSFASQAGVTLTREMLISAQSDEPVNENYFREEYIANQQRNLENGIITQEEYDSMINEIKQYAVVVD